MASPARGILGVVLENVTTPGIIALLPDTALAATINSGFTQPIGSTGMRVEIVVKNNTTTGTVTVVGTDPLGNAATETSETVPVPPAGGQSAVLSAFRHTTTKVYASITSVTVTSPLVTGGGTVALNGVQAEKYLLPVLTFKYTDKRPNYSPNIFDGTYARHRNIIQLLVNEGWEATMALYPESSMIIAYLLFGAPTSVVTIPASPTALGTNSSITTQPTLPGMSLIYTVTGSSAVGTIPITGTNQYGQAVSETLVCNGNGTNGNGTYYSANIYKNIATSGMTGLTGGSYTIGGVFGYNCTWNDLTNADTLQSACNNFYSGTDTRALPYSFASEAEFDFGVSKEYTCTFKGDCQDSLPIGDRTTAPMSGSRLSTLAVPISVPIAGWQSLIWLDPISGTPQTTPYTGGAIDECKISVKTPREMIYGANNTQRFATAYSKKDGREFSFEIKVDFRDLVQYELWRKNQKQYLAVGAIGPFIGNSGGVSYTKAWYWTLPFKYDADGVAPESDPGKANVTATYKGMAEHDPAQGYSIQLTVISQMPPVIAL